MLFAVGFGVPAGAIAAVKRGSIFDQALMTVSLFGYSMPIFWWGLLLIMFVSVRLGLLPVSGRIDLVNFYFDQPTGFMTIDALLVRSARRVYRRAAPSRSAGDRARHRAARGHRAHDALFDARGPERRLRPHRPREGAVAEPGSSACMRLRNALLPVVTVIGLSVSGLMAGAVLTETIFSWPGVGKWLIESIGRRDYPALQGGVMLVSAVVISVNLIVDLIYGAIDPRIRHGR